MKNGYFYNSYRYKFNVGNIFPRKLTYYYIINLHNNIMLYIVNIEFNTYQLKPTRQSAVESLNSVEILDID